MILRGILDNSLGGAICIRGYANISDIAKASEPNEQYQRDIIPEHKKELKSYLEKRKYLFFPEVVLSYTINNDIDNINIESSLTEYFKIKGKKDKKIKFSTFKKSYAGEDSRSKETLNLITIEIDDVLLRGMKPFKRIDGNHRLTASEEVDDYYKNFKIPFCIILLKDDIDANKYESVVFHNINSKGRHLTSEENLKAILNKKYFTDEELNENFSWAYVKARDLIEKIDFGYLDAIKNSFVNKNNTTELHIRTVAIKILEFLKFKKLIRKSVSIDNLVKKLNVINSIYKSVDELKNSTDEGLLVAFIYYAFKHEERKLAAFKNWVLDNSIHELNNIETESIVKIYDKVLERELRIFMAMPYFNHKEVDNYNEILKRVIDTILIKNPHLKLSMHPIMREKGASMDIVANLLTNIRNCEIFIADITDNNVNVFYEYGYAQSLNKPVVLVKDENCKKKPPFDVEHLLRLTYNGHLGLENILVDRIIQTVKQLGFPLNE